MELGFVYFVFAALGRHDAAGRAGRRAVRNPAIHLGRVGAGRRSACR